MFSRFFVERPIFAAVVSIILCLAGAVAMVVLPVQQYPTITPVQVTVAATYPGADSQTLADSVAAPIEAQINGVDNMLYMSSTSSANGQLTLTVYFSLDTDPDIAQVQVQNRVNLALPQLPAAVTQLGVSVQKKSSSIMMLIGVFGKGDRYTPDFIANYANVYVLDAVKRVPGAGQAQVMGVADQAMRIWLNPRSRASTSRSSCERARTGARSFGWGMWRARKSGCASTSSTRSSTGRRRRSSQSICSRARTASRCPMRCARRLRT
jgi:multidrug efflux pump